MLVFILNKKQYHNVILKKYNPILFIPFAKGWNTILELPWD